ncbi:hypothetical protein AX774_g121 [Zancudomyces culisetae]|uniref:Uncharacterized protein n=1 Tax=Zancudomyces culisetae TaxID=1213189 RepID=A0A1R1PZ55_ZANCU|nr:hypothetical protein AX774_g121 [Zancudomyces culisetae]|eukprot:OMH86230.1 hypothetical protein AX774_g121 [Zancudomyces culisetae]
MWKSCSKNHISALSLANLGPAPYLPAFGTTSCLLNASHCFSIRSGILAFMLLNLAIPFTFSRISFSPSISTSSSPGSLVCDLETVSLMLLTNTSKTSLPSSACSICSCDTIGHVLSGGNAIFLIRIFRAILVSTICCISYGKIPLSAISLPGSNSSANENAGIEYPLLPSATFPLKYAIISIAFSNITL